MAITAGKQMRNLAGGRDDFAGGKANDIVYAGGIVMLDSSGRAINGAAATGSLGVGVALTNRDLDRYDSTGLADGALTIRWDEGTFVFKNSGTQPFLSTDQPGAVAWIEDNETISKTSQANTLSTAGIFHHLDADGVWVTMGKFVGAYAKVLSTVTDASAAHLAGTETFTGTKTFADMVLATGKVFGFGPSQALSGAGACDVVSLTTLFTSTGAANALTLANGTQVGQLKIVHHTVKGASGTGVLTPASAGNFATFTLTNLHDACLLQWSGTVWNIVMNVGGTIA